MYNQPGPNYYQPPRPQQPPKWYKSDGGIILLLILFFPVGLVLMWLYASWRTKAKLIVTGIFAVITIIVYAANGLHPQSADIAPTPQAQHIAPTVVARPTATPKPAPTATPKPTPTPQIPASRAKVDQLAGSLDNVTVTSYDQATGVLVVEMDSGSKVAFSQNEAKSFLQDMQSKFWKDGAYFSSVTTNIMQYQPDRTLVKEASATFKYQTAHNIDFSFATYSSLWDAYDSKFLDPALPDF